MTSSLLHGSRVTRRAMTAFATAISLACLGGCSDKKDSLSTSPSQSGKRQPTLDQITAMRDPNVVGVAALYNPFDPWLWSENHEKPRGIVIRALYLMGPQYKGIFGDGTIRPRLYVRDLNEQGEVTWKQVKEWSFTVDDAVPYRSKRQSEMGWGYRLHLPWDQLSDLAGKQVRIVVEFERSDGRRVASDKKDFRVPSPNIS